MPTQNHTPLRQRVTTLEAPARRIARAADAHTLAAQNFKARRRDAVERPVMRSRAVRARSTGLLVTQGVPESVIDDFLPRGWSRVAWPRRPSW